MVMFKAKFKPMVASDKPTASETPRRAKQAAGQRVQQQQQQQPQPQVPPIEEERGPQHPIREPAPVHEPERARH